MLLISKTTASNNVAAFYTLIGTLMTTSLGIYVFYGGLSFMNRFKAPE